MKLHQIGGALPAGAMVRNTLRGADFAFWRFSTNARVGWLGVARKRHGIVQAGPNRTNSPVGGNPPAATAQLRILNALAELEAIGIGPVDRTQAQRSENDRI